MLWSHEECVERSWAGASNGGKRGSMGMRGLMCQGAVDVVSSPFSLFLHCFSLSYCLLLHHTQEHRTCLHSLPCLAPRSGGWEQERSWDQGLFLLQGRSKTSKSMRRAGARDFWSWLCLGCGSCCLWENLTHPWQGRAEDQRAAAR